MKAPPASSRHLSAFAIDIDHELEQTGLFSKIKIKKTGTPQCALVVVCTLADGSTTPAAASLSLERAWNQSLAYYHGENSHRITASSGGLQMEFSTSTLESSVTGRIEVVGFKGTNSCTVASAPIR